MSTIPISALTHTLPTPRYGQYPYACAQQYHPGILEVTHSLFQTKCPPPSSETQGQSVGPGKKARRKFLSIGGRAPGYRLSPDHCSKWSSECSLLIGHKNCFVLLCPIGEQYLLSSFNFVSSYTTAIYSITACLETQAVRKLKLPFSKYCLPKN